MSKNKTIWINGQAHFKPDTYTFKNGMVTYYLEDHRLFAQVWRLGYRDANLTLHKTTEIFENDDKSMSELIGDIT